jgi:hypothetical protein
MPLIKRKRDQISTIMTSWRYGRTLYMKRIWMWLSKINGAIMNN